MPEIKYNIVIINYRKISGFNGGWFQNWKVRTQNVWEVHFIWCKFSNCNFMPWISMLWHWFQIRVLKRGKSSIGTCFRFHTHNFYAHSKSPHCWNISSVSSKISHSEFMFVGIRLSFRLKMHPGSFSSEVCVPYPVTLVDCNIIISFVSFQSEGQLYHREHKLAVEKFGDSFYASVTWKNTVRIFGRSGSWSSDGILSMSIFIHSSRSSEYFKTW